MKRFHEHPLRILKYSIKNIWLLIFPLIRNISTIRLNRDWLVQWVRGAWFDLIFVGVILIFGLIRWSSSRIVIGENDIFHDMGYILRVSKSIPYKNISTATVESPIWLKPFNGVYVRCDTSAGIFRSPDMKVMMRGRDAAEVIKKIPDVGAETKLRTQNDPSELSVLLFSAFFSSGFSGVAYVTLFFIKGGDIARNIINVSLNRIQTETAKITERLVLNIPFAAVLIGLILILLWLLSFIVNLLRYSHFHIELDKNCLKVIYGITTKKEFRVMPHHINYTDMHQNLIMKFAKKVAVNINCAGYGSDKNSIPVLMPIKDERSIGKEFESIGIFAGMKNDFGTKRFGFWSYIWLPVILGAAIVPAQRRIGGFFPRFEELSHFVMIMAEVLLVWFILIKLTAWWTSGVALYDDKVLVRCCKWSLFHTVISERRKLVKVTFEQTVFQKFWGTCSIGFWFEGEEYKKYKVKSMSVRNALKIAALLEHSDGRQLSTGVFNKGK